MRYILILFILSSYVFSCVGEECKNSTKEAPPKSDSTRSYRDPMLYQHNRTVVARHMLRANAIIQGTSFRLSKYNLLEIYKRSFYFNLLNKNVFYKYGILKNEVKILQSEQISAKIKKNKR